MNSFILTIIFITIHSIECNSRPFYCRLLLNDKMNDTFEGIQVFTKWFFTGEKIENYDNKLLMYRTDLEKEWEFKLIYDGKGTVIDIEFIENSTKSIKKDILNRFTFNYLRKDESYECFTTYKV